MEKTWKPTAAGVLCIITGVIFVMLSIIPALLLAVTGEGWPRAISALLIIAGIVPIVGGICALRRKTWGMALAGSICTLICAATSLVILLLFWLFISVGGSDNPGSTPPTIPDALLFGPPLGLGIFGILAIIFVIMGRREFR